MCLFGLHGVGNILRICRFVRGGGNGAAVGGQEFAVLALGFDLVIAAVSGLKIVYRDNGKVGVVFQQRLSYGDPIAPFPGDLPGVFAGFRHLIHDGVDVLHLNLQPVAFNHNIVGCSGIDVVRNQDKLDRLHRQCPKLFGDHVVVRVDVSPVDVVCIGRASGVGDRSGRVYDGCIAFYPGPGIDTLINQGRAVVNSVGGAGFDRDRYGRHFQHAGLCRDRVVLAPGLAPVDGIRILRSSRIRDRAGGCDGDHVAADQALNLDDLGAVQGHTVELLGGARRDRQLCGLDLQTVVDICDLVVVLVPRAEIALRLKGPGAGVFVSLSFQNELSAAGQFKDEEVVGFRLLVRFRFDRIRFFIRAVNGRLDPFGVIDVAIVCFNRAFLSGRLSGIRVDDAFPVETEIKLHRKRIYRQRAALHDDFCEFAGHIIVVLVKDHVRGDAVFAAAGVCLAAGNAGPDLVAGGQAFGCYGAGRQRRAVVGLLGGGRSQRDRALRLRDRQGAEILINGIVSAVCAAPLDGIGVARGTRIRDGAGRRHRSGLAIDETGEARGGVRQRLAVVFLFGGAGRDREGGAVHRQRTQLFPDFIVVLVRVSPVDDIGVEAGPGVGLAAGGRHPDRLVHGGTAVECLLASEGPVVVIGDLRINGDLHIAEVLHQAVGVRLRDLQTGLHDGGILRRGLRKLLDKLPEKIVVPAGILAGLLQKGRVGRINAQQLLGKLVFAQVLNLQFDALFAVQIGEEDRQLLTGPQLELAPLAGKRVGGVHPYDAAEPVQGLAVKYCALGRFCDDPGGIAPRLLPLLSALVEGDVRLRVRQGPAVIDLRGAAGVDDKGSGHHQKGAADLLHIRKVAGDILAALVVDGVERYGVFALARVRAAAAGFGPDTEAFGKAADKNVRAAIQRPTVIVFARALRDKGNRGVPCPVAVR